TLEGSRPPGTEIDVACGVAGTRAVAAGRRTDDRVPQRDALARQSEKRRYVRCGHVCGLVALRSTAPPTPEQRDSDDASGGARKQAGEPAREQPPARSDAFHQKPPGSTAPDGTHLFQTRGKRLCVTSATLRGLSSSGRRGYRVAMVADQRL